MCGDSGAESDDASDICRIYWLPDTSNENLINARGIYSGFGKNVLKCMSSEVDCAFPCEVRSRFTERGASTVDNVEWLDHYG